MPAPATSRAQAAASAVGRERRSRGQTRRRVRVRHGRGHLADRAVVGGQALVQDAAGDVCLAAAPLSRGGTRGRARRRAPRRWVRRRGHRAAGDAGRAGGRGREQRGHVAASRGRLSDHGRRRSPAPSRSRRSIRRRTRKAVAAVCELLGERLRLGDDERRLLRYGAILHDIGKIGVPERILRKPGPLTAEEHSVDHGAHGAGRAHRVRDRLPASCRTGRSGRRTSAGTAAAIPTAAPPTTSRWRRASCSWRTRTCAMTADRPYREALSHEAALEEIARNAGEAVRPRTSRRSCWTRRTW